MQLLCIVGNQKHCRYGGMSKTEGDKRVNQYFWKTTNTGDKSFQTLELRGHHQHPSIYDSHRLWAVNLIGVLDLPAEQIYNIYNCVLVGLHSAPSNRHLEEYIERINASRPQCPVGLNTLVLPKRNVKVDRSRQPYVYLACGHVHGSHEWKNGTVSRTCPMCMKVRLGLWDWADGTLVSLGRA